MLKKAFWVLSFFLLLSGFLSHSSLVFAQSNEEICDRVEMGSRYSRDVVSGASTNISSAQNLALVATILNDDGNRRNITWTASGGKLHNTSWDLTEWRAPVAPGTYTVNLSINRSPQPNCTATFVVLPNTSYVTCDKLESDFRHSGDVISEITTNVSAGERVQIIASILNDDGNHRNIKWTTNGGVLSRHSWDLIQWTAPYKEGLHTVQMSIYGVPQPTCTATFAVSAPVATPTPTDSASPSAYPFYNGFPQVTIFPSDITQPSASGTPATNKNIEELDQKINKLQEQLAETNKKQQTLIDTLNNFLAWAKAHLPFF